MKLKNISLNNEFMLICIWGLFCFRLISDISGIDYLILVLTGSSSVFFVIRKGIRIECIKTEIFLVSLLLIEMWGMLNNWGVQALKNILGLLLIICFIYWCYEVDYCSEKSIYIILYYMFLLALLMVFFVKKNTFFYEKNTLAAGILFIHLAYVLFFLEYKKKKNILWVGQLIISTMLSIFFTYITGSRTALAIYFIVGGVFIALFIVKLPSQYLRYIFWILVLTAVFVIWFYINIRSFSWYDKVNQYSQQFFHKNIDSARPHLWSTELARLNGHILNGLGTGVLPQMNRYAESSFHNTYIQLVIQNGVIGLGIFLLFMDALWKEIVKKSEFIVGKYILSVFIGVIIYNCFEVTLLSNKIFIGIVQWFILGIGINILRKEIYNN